MSSGPNTNAAPRRIAVIGNGFIGSRIAQLAVAQGIETRVLTRRTPETAVPGVEYVVGDATDPAVVVAAMSDAHHVVYAAGTANPVESNADPVADSLRNLAPLIAVLEETTRLHSPILTFLSSGGTVYGPDQTGPVTEDAPLWPASTYGVLKVAAERFVVMYARRHGFDADILRCANVYGPGQPTSGSQGAIGVFLSLMTAARPITVFGDGSACRDFIHVDDVADVALRLAQVPQGCRVLNVGAGSSITINGLIDTIATHLSVEPDITYEPARPADVPAVVMDTSRLRSLVSFEPRSIGEGLTSLVPTGARAPVNG